MQINIEETRKTNRKIRSALESIRKIEITSSQAKTKEREKWLWARKKCIAKIRHFSPEIVKENPVTKIIRCAKVRGIFNIFVSIILIYRIILF